MCDLDTLRTFYMQRSVSERSQQDQKNNIHAQFSHWNYAKLNRDVYTS